MSKTIGQLDPAAALDGTELVEIEQGGVSAHTTVDEIAARAGTATGGVLTGINPQSGTAYTLVLSDKGKLIENANAAAIATTVPPNSAVAFPVGSIVYIAQAGAGQVTITAGAGVTLKPATAKTRAQDAVVAIVKTDTDTWRVMGDLA